MFVMLALTDFGRDHVIIVYQLGASARSPPSAGTLSAGILV